MSSTGVARIAGIDPFVAIKAPCKAATTANITLSGAQTIDGVSVTETTPKIRVLVRSQTDSTENGVYDVYDTSWVRSDDFNGTRDVTDGTIITVTDGTTNTGDWKLQVTGEVVFGTTSLVFSVANSFGEGVSESYDSVNAFLAASPGTGRVEIKSYYGGWSGTAAGPKGAHYRHKTGETVSTTSVPNPAAGTEGTAANGNAGYSWTADEVEWLISWSDQLDVTWLGALGDGSTDDTNAFLAAAEMLQPNGGTLRIPTPGVYPISEEVAFSSDHSVFIESDMGADNTASPESCIIPIANITGSMFKISARGGTIRGLAFSDLTGQIGVSQGSYTMDAALELSVFGMGTVEGCFFDQILGSGILADNMIRGNLTRIHMRDCGTPTKPALWLNSSTALIPGQVTITNCHLETCYGDYINVGSNAHNTKIAACHFESDDANASTHMPYIQNSGGFTLISTCSFNQTGAKYVVLDGARTQIDNCQFLALSGALSLARIELNSSFNTISNCIFNGTSADVGTVIDDDNGENSFNNCVINAGGNVKLGTNSVWTGGKLVSLITTQAYCIVASSESTVSTTRITGATVAGGVSVTTRCNLSGVSVRNCAGIGILVSSSTASVVGNSSSGNSGGDWSFTAYPASYNPNNNYASDSTLALKASTTWNPGSLADGASASQNITVTGAAKGDIAIASFPVIASSSPVDGIQISASAYAANTVKVTITNNSGGVVDLDSDTLKVVVLKQ